MEAMLVLCFIFIFKNSNVNVLIQSTCHLENICSQACNIHAADYNFFSAPTSLCTIIESSAMLSFLKEKYIMKKKKRNSIIGPHYWMFFPTF